MMNSKIFLKNYKMNKDFVINSGDMFQLIAAVYLEMKIGGKEWKYNNLLEQVDTYKLNNTPFNPNIHNIDDFMVEAYKVYDKYLLIKDKIDEALQITGLSNNPFFTKEKIKKEFDIIMNTVEQILINCNFKGVQIRGIQKNFLNDKLKESIEQENYELCAILKEKIDNL